MPVRRRPNGSWLVDYRDRGERVRKTLPSDFPLKEVKALERRWRVEAEKGERRRSGADTLGTLLARYWENHGTHLASRLSEKAYLDRWADELGDGTRLAAIDARRVADAVAKWRSTPEVPGGKRTAKLLTASSINHRIGCLQRVWAMAEEMWGYELARVPWRRLKLDEPEPENRTAGITAEKLRRYFDALPSPSLWLAAMAIHCGLRRGGLLSVHRRHVDFDAGLIHAVSKGRAGGKPTPIFMTEPVLGVLMAMGRLPDVGPIFVLTKDQLRRDHERARKAAGLPHFRLHDLRHLFAQRLEDAGLGYRITDALHHSDPRLRNRYSQAKPRDVGAAVEEAWRRSQEGEGHPRGTRPAAEFKKRHIS